MPFKLLVTSTVTSCMCVFFYQVDDVVTFEVGSLEKTIEITILDDTTPESSELFYVELYDPVGMGYVII